MRICSSFLDLKGPMRTLLAGPQPRLRLQPPARGSDMEQTVYSSALTLISTSLNE